MTIQQKKTRQYNKRYYKKNRQHLILQVREYRKKNKKKISKTRRVHYLKNKLQILHMNLRYRQQNSKQCLEQKRLYRLRKMGLSVVEIEKAKTALRNHNGRCAICGTKKPGGMGGWLIDHNHKTKKFRGIICNKCNALMGFAKDMCKILRAAIWYLRRSP